MILNHELMKLSPAVPCPARSLSVEEIDALQSAGLITPMELIPKERNFHRVSVPQYKGSTFGHILQRRRFK